MLRGRHIAGRFAQARGSSSWARAFNATLHSSTMPRLIQTRLLSSMVSMNLSQCLGEVPLCGFAEQYRSITQSFNGVGGQSGSNGEVSEGDADAQIVAGSMSDEMEFVQIAEVPTLFTYCDQKDRNHNRH